MKKYISSERPNLFEPNVYISMVVSLEGNITREEISNAVNEAYSKNEATMCKVVLEKTGEAYYEQLPFTGCKVSYDSREWQEIIREGERLPFAIHEGEMVRTYIISKEQGFSLLIMAHHLVGDGKSIITLIQDVIDILTGTQIEYRPMEILEKKYLSEKARLPFIVKSLVRHVNNKWKKKGKVFTWNDYYAVHRKYWEKHSSKVEIKTYIADELKRECNGKATLNSYLIAKLLQEYPESKVVGVPISIREDTKTMANLTSGIAIKYQYELKKSLETNLIVLHKKLQEKLQNTNSKYFVLLFISKLYPSLVDAVLLEAHGCYQSKLSYKMAHILGYIGDNSRDLGVTNLMRIDIPSDYENFRIQDILFIPPKVSYSKNVVGVCTFGDKLNVCHHHMVYFS